VDSERPSTACSSGFEPHFEPDAEASAILHDLLDDVPLLVDLDREDAAVAAAILPVLQCLGEGAVQELDPVIEDVTKAQEQRGRVASFDEAGHQAMEVEARPAVAARPHLEAPVLAGTEVAATPSRDLVELFAVLGGPGLRRSIGHRSLLAASRSRLRARRR
jgi:hypothetical protein